MLSFLKSRLWLLLSLSSKTLQGLALPLLCFRYPLTFIRPLPPSLSDSALSFWLLSPETHVPTPFSLEWPCLCTNDSISPIPRQYSEDKLLWALVRLLQESRNFRNRCLPQSCSLSRAAEFNSSSSNPTPNSPFTASFRHSPSALGSYSWNGCVVFPITFATISPHPVELLEMEPYLHIVTLQSAIRIGGALL